MDTEKIVACGSSAGAITALQVEYLLCNEATRTPQLPGRFQYAGVVSFAGAVCSIGAPVWQQRPCPILFFHGDADCIVPYEKAVTSDGAGLWGSYFLSRQLKEMRMPYGLYVEKGASHEMSGTPMHRNGYDILSFLQELVEGKQARSVETYVTVPGKDSYKTDFTLEDYIRANIDS